MSAVFEPTRMRISADRYQKMVAAGVLTKDDRVELIEGEIVTMSPVGSMHAAIVAQIDRWFNVKLDGRATVFSSGPVNLGDFSEPQPDILLLKYRADFYRHKIADICDALLVVEVSDSSLRHDLTTKMRLYARYGAVEYWTVDVNGACVVVHRAPDRERFADVKELRGADLLAPQAFPECSIAVCQLFE